jgi:hypothetical protein
MSLDPISLRDMVRGFAAGEDLRAVLVLTYSFDGVWFEENVIPDIFERPVSVSLLVRDRNALVTEAPVCCWRVDASYSTKVFHPKMLLLVSENRAIALCGSANMTRGGFERNLELGMALEIGPEGGPKRVFREIQEYVEGPLRREVANTSLKKLEEIAVALREVIQRVPADHDGTQHVLLHNYEKSIWEQVLDHLPHRHLRRAIIVSPFYEPDGSREDPAEELEEGDSMFEKLFRDFKFEPPIGEKPVTVYFRQDEGFTQLPVKKLRKWQDLIGLHTQDLTADPRGLHAKMLVLEGGGNNRKPYVYVLAGSPNFTSAALLKTPPKGNAELGIFTAVVPKAGELEKIVRVMELRARFTPVRDWDAIGFKPRSQQMPPPPPFFAEVLLRVDDAKLELSVRGLPAGTAHLSVSAPIDGSWARVGNTAAEANATYILAAPTLISVDQLTGLPKVQAGRVRIAASTADERSLGELEVPLNVDRPELFCGMTMTSASRFSLDEKIAQAGVGSWTTYRDQLDWLEQLSLSKRDDALGAPKPSHHANLDRFYCNVSAGFRGIRNHLAARPSSEFTLRHTLVELARWCTEATVANDEVLRSDCRIYLLDRLAAEIASALDRGDRQPMLKPKLHRICTEIHLEDAIESARALLSKCKDKDTAEYARDVRRRFVSLGARGKRLAASHG